VRILYDVQALEIYERVAEAWPAVRGPGKHAWSRGQIRVFCAEIVRLGGFGVGTEALAAAVDRLIAARARPPSMPDVLGVLKRATAAHVEMARGTPAVRLVSEWVG
jgi:hypothetical protein